ncbi:hypothetical protein BJY00DRAFT_267303 [Aspergillus carlsbadensis]|nr:hypothetical protein BJY00DRAFT_267303 [Aspergillus carlsbadensis]
MVPINQLLTVRQFFSHPREPDAVSSGRFTYRSDGHLYVDGHKRAPWEQLEARAEFAESAWIIAQLTLWGISFQDADADAVLRAKLRSALDSIKNTGASPEVNSIEASLKDEYAKKMEDYEEARLEWRRDWFSKEQTPSGEASFDPELFLAKYFLTELQGTPDKTKQKTPMILSKMISHERKLEEAVRRVPGLSMHVKNVGTVIGWEESIPAAMKELFGTLCRQQRRLADNLPTAEVEFDVDMFLAKYFLKPNGQPDPRKTKLPIRIDPRSYSVPHFLAMKVEKIPGLHLASAKTTGFFSQKTYFIGWDLDKINKRIRAADEKAAKEEAEREARAEARAIKDKERQEKEEKKAEKKKAALFKPHHDFMATLGPGPQPGEFSLNDITGSYLVQSEDMQYTVWVERWDRLEMHIQPPKSPHGVVASMDFGFVKGMMLLALSTQSLRDLADEMMVDPNRPGNEEEERTSDAEVPVPGTRKRKRKSARKPKGPVPPVSRVFGGIGPQPRRVFFRWVGEDPKSKKFEVPAGVDQASNCGYLDFEASRGVARGKLAYFPHLFGKHKLALQLYKVSSEPREEPLRKWSDYQSPPNAVGSRN